MYHASAQGTDERMINIHYFVSCYNLEVHFTDVGILVYVLSLG